MFVTCRTLTLICMAAVFSGCAVPYYWQAVGGQIELLRKRTPIESVVADPEQDESVKVTLNSIAETRRFAVETLLLPGNDSYTTYVELDRPYVVWNVMAAEEFAVDPMRWCFLFVGCVAYRGYFDREDAERYRVRLEQQGLDTYLGGSTAYSTLGYFDDPVLSTMLGGGSQYIAGLLFHELAHQKLYIKGDTDFSEAFATAVEEYGMQLWLAQQPGEAALMSYRQRLARRAQFGELVNRQQTRLRAVYDQQETEQAKRIAKAEAFATLRDEYAQVKESWGGSSEYDAWFAQPLNNATLGAVATYRRWLPALRWQLEQLGFEDFYLEMQRLAELPEEERETRLEAWGATAISARSSASIVTVD